MTLPVSSYEELLIRVRSLTQETRQLQRQLDSPLLDHNDNEPMSNSNTMWDSGRADRSLSSQEPPQLPDPDVVNKSGGAVLARLLRPNKEDVTAAETKEQDERRTTPETSPRDPTHKWIPTEFNLWHSVGTATTIQTSTVQHDDILSMGPRSYSQHQLGAKVEMVYSLLSMLETQDRDEMTQTLLSLSTTPESCLAMRQSEYDEDYDYELHDYVPFEDKSWMYVSILETVNREEVAGDLLILSTYSNGCLSMKWAGCIPLLVELVHGGQETPAVRRTAAQALHNVVHCHTDDKKGRREVRVLRLLEHIQEYCSNMTNAQSEPAQEDPHPCVQIAALMKLSFDEDHRKAMCLLGALQTVACLIKTDNEAHGAECNNTECVTVRRYAGMALTNLTFGDCNNKALLCSMRGFLPALVSQLRSPNEDLRQVTASVMRNLSWRADAQSKQALRQVDACTALMLTALDATKESTIKSILSALWNLSAHCNMNKADICAVNGALQYLVEMLRFEDAPSKTLAIVENAGGILRNVSSHIAVRDDYRAILREHNCIPLLLQHLKSASLTVVSNACGTLWNLSARCPLDQRTLWELGAVPMLRSLVHSKHKMISMGSSASLKNLLAARPDADIMDRASRGEMQVEIMETHDPDNPAPDPSCVQTAEPSTSIEMETSDPDNSAPDPSCVQTAEPSTSTEMETSDLGDSAPDPSCVQTTEPTTSIEMETSDPGNSAPDPSCVQTTEPTTSIEMETSDPGNSAPDPSCVQTTEPTTSIEMETSDPGNSAPDPSCVETTEPTTSIETDLYDLPETFCENTHLAPDPSTLQTDDPSTLLQVANPSDYSLNSQGEMQEKENMETSNPENPTPDPSCVQTAEPSTSIEMETSDPDNSAADPSCVQTAEPTTSIETDCGYIPLTRRPSVLQTDYLSALLQQGNPWGDSALLQQANPWGDSWDSQGMPTLLVRKRRALEQELDSTLAETCENIEAVERWDSRESVTSTQSDNIFDRSHRSIPCHRSGSLQLASVRRKEEEKPQPEALIERLTLEDSSATSDQPVNYSLKYSEQETQSIAGQPEQPIKYVLKYPEQQKLAPVRGKEEEKPQPEALIERLTLEDSSATSDQPVNYSLKYSEQEAQPIAGQPEQPVNYSLKYPEQEKEVVDYAETDLDQPTDYSLKYRESDKAPADESNVYAETDLDQPTDYSLRYAEEDTEKPKTYCTEGTPYNFSTATSLSDLCTPDPPNKSAEPKSGGLSPVGSLTHDDNININNVPTPNQVKEETREGKVVTFETPLMFSRCSSLGSLSSVEPPDDRSSVVSEFSRMTSGMVSPSELPDSPTQTVPPSPHCVKPPIAIPAQAKPVSVFEERVSVFKEESTPVHFSTATSLSDLTFDDEPPMEVDRKCDLSDPTSELAPVDEEEDDDMLAACINIGMQNSNSFRRNVGKATPVLRCAPTQRPSGIPVKAFVSRPTPSFKSINIPESEVLEDCTKVFVTEDTPANISHATSHSDLSNLCALSDDSDHDNILAECIQSGMPQARLTPNSNIKKPTKVATVLPMPVKTSLLPQRQSQPLHLHNALPKSVQQITQRVKADLTQEAYIDNVIESNAKPNSRSQAISPVPEDKSSPLSSLDPDVEEAVTVLSRQPSTGSLSGEWTEDQVTLSEQVLLEQCITSGMPKTKNGVGGGLADDGGASDTSPSFPSISLTAPLISSYKSLEESGHTPLIHLESGKVGIISNLEMESSLQSVDLEAVRPPSCMGSLLSLTASVSETDRRKPRSLLPPLSWNNLDSIKPPSGMDEVMELENSILSCASITSEVADSPPDSEDVTLAESEQPSSLTPRLTPKMKRQMLKDRFNTYTITGDKSSRDSSLDADVNLDSEVAEPPIEPSSPAKPKKLTPKQRRLADKERFRTRTLGDEQIPVPLSPREKRLVDKNRFRTQTLDAPAIISSEIPNITSTTGIKPEITSEFANEELDNESDNEETFENDNEADEKPKPIVVKPLEVKSVRGRKKVRSHIPVVSRSPANKSKSPKPPAPLQRQGTFTKDEPQVSSSIPVLANSGVKKQIPVKKKTISGTTGIPAAPLSKKVVASVGRGRAGSLPRSEGTPKAASGVRSSKSNQSLKSETLGPGARWNSNSSLHNPTPTPIPATSKIASLWKKVEDSKKKKEAEGKDKRVWIGPNSTPLHSKQAV